MTEQGLGPLKLLLNQEWWSWEHPETVLLEGTALLFSSREVFEAFVKRAHPVPLGDGWYEARSVIWTPAHDEAKLRPPAPGREIFARLASLEPWVIRFDGTPVVGGFAAAALEGRDLREDDELQCPGWWAGILRTRAGLVDGTFEIPEAWRTEADELLTRIDPTTDAIPRSLLRHHYGAHQVFQAPELLQGPWLRAARARLG